MLSLLLGLIPGLANTLAAWVTARGNEQLAQIGADKDVALAHLNAITAANQAKAGIITLPWAKWLMFLLYLPPLLHAAGIELGRMHLIDFDMLPMDQNEVYILLSLVVYVPAAKMTSK
jgi:hypothetical protein